MLDFGLWPKLGSILCPPDLLSAIWQARSIKPMVGYKLGGKSEVALLLSNRSWKGTNVDYSLESESYTLFSLGVGTYRDVSIETSKQGAPGL